MGCEAGKEMNLCVRSRSVLQELVLSVLTCFMLSLWYHFGNFCCSTQGVGSIIKNKIHLKGLGPCFLNRKMRVFEMTKCDPNGSHVAMVFRHRGVIRKLRFSTTSD